MLIDSDPVLQSPLSLSKFFAIGAGALKPHIRDEGERKEVKVGESKRERQTESFGKEIQRKANKQFRFKFKFKTNSIFLPINSDTLLEARSYFIFLTP